MWLAKIVMLFNWISLAFNPFKHVITVEVEQESINRVSQRMLLKIHKIYEIYQEFLNASIDT